MRIPVDGGWLGCVADARDYYSQATFSVVFFSNLARLESFFSLLLLLLFWTIWYPAVFIFKRQMKRARRSLNEKIRVCEDLWIGYNLTRSPQGHSLLWPKQKAQPEKGTLFGLWVHERVGISLVEVYRTVEKSDILSVKGAKRANRRILLMWKETRKRPSLVIYCY